MDNVFFVKEMSRLSERWPGIYTTSVSALIWNQIKDLTNEEFVEIITEFLGSMRSAPLLPDICLKASEIREHKYKLKRKQEEQDSKDFWSGTYHPEEKKWMFDMIRNRLKGFVSDQDWLQFMKLIEKKTSRVAK